MAKSSKTAKATATKGKATTAPKAAAAAKPTVAKVVKSYPHTFDFRRPVADAATEIAFGEALAEGKTPSPNTGLMTAKALGDSVRAQQAAELAGEYAPSAPPVYSMIRRGAANANRATCIVSGQASKGKKPLKAHNVPDKLAASFGEGDRIFTNADGEAIPLRLCHKPDVRKLVTETSENVKTIRDHEYVVGTTEVSAVFLANASKTGCYGANIAAGKALSFDGMGSKIKNLVGQINNAFEIVTLDDGTEPGCQYPIPPNSIIRWGHLERGGKVMSPAQVRKAVDSEDVTGIKFVALKEAIVGASFTKGKLWQAVSRLMKRATTKRGDGDDSTTALERFESRESRSGEDATAMTDRAWSNLRDVQTRTKPNELNPFGLFSLQTGVVPVAHFGETIDEKLVRMVIGVMVGAEYSENKWEANFRINPDDYEDAADETVAEAQDETDAPEVVDASETDAETETVEEPVTA